MDQVLIHERDCDQKHKKLHDMVDTLIQKYSTNEYVEGKLIHFIENMLPTALENANNTFSQRSERKQQLTAHTTLPNVFSRNINTFICHTRKPSSNMITCILVSIVKTTSNTKF